MDALLLKNGRILIWCLFSEINVNCMLIASFILWIFTVNAFFFSSLAVAYVCTFSSSQGFKKHNSGWKNGHILLKMYFWTLISNMKVTCMPIASFILLPFSVNPFFFNSLIVAYVRIFPYVQNARIISRKNSHILQKNIVFDAFFSRWRLLVYQLLILYSDYLL